MKRKLQIWEVINLGSNISMSQFHTTDKKVEQRIILAETKLSLLLPRKRLSCIVKE